MAAPGHPGEYYDGGDGYSGGGGYGGCDGGSGGGDGVCWGGRGTGEDITSYELQNYQLSAGAGGQYYPNDVYDHGGGGGGVLVDGAGPDVEEKSKKRGTLWTHGQGYGVIVIDMGIVGLLFLKLG